MVGSRHHMSRSHPKKNASADHSFKVGANIGEAQEIELDDESQKFDESLALVTLEHQPDHKLEAIGIRQVFNEGEPNEVVALNGMDLSAEGSQIVGLVGPSGCGKSTFLRIVAGLDKASSGEAYYDGKLIEGTDWHRGVVFQGAQLFEFLNVHDNIAFGLKARGIYKGNEKKVDDFIKLVGLEGFAEAYPHQISGGMAARVAIARALIQEPGLVLLDEPLSALDAFTRGTIQDEILRLVKMSNTLSVLVTHDIEEAVYMCDRVFVMSARPGRVIDVVDVNLDHPRDRMSAEFVALRRRVFDALNESHAF